MTVGEPLNHPGNGGGIVLIEVLAFGRDSKDTGLRLDFRELALQADDLLVVRIGLDCAKDLAECARRILEAVCMAHQLHRGERRG